MKKILQIIIIIGVVFALSFAADAEDMYKKWNGTYSYDIFLGRTVGGDAIVYGITLVISSAGRCEIAEDGFQIMSRIICYLSQNKLGVDVKFKNYKKDNFLDAGYKQNDLLLSLNYNKINKLITTWHALEPDVKKSEGEYLKRVEK